MTDDWIHRNTNLKINKIVNTVIENNNKIIENWFLHDLIKLDTIYVFKLLCLFVDIFFYGRFKKKKKTYTQYD